MEDKLSSWSAFLQAASCSDVREDSVAHPPPQALRNPPRANCTYIICHRNHTCSRNDARPRRSGYLVPRRSLCAAARTKAVVPPEALRYSSTSHSVPGLGALQLTVGTGTPSQYIRRRKLEGRRLARLQLCTDRVAPAATQRAVAGCAVPGSAPVACFVATVGTR